MLYDEAHGFLSLDGPELRGGAADTGRPLSALAPAPLGGGGTAERVRWRSGLQLQPDLARERATKALGRLADPQRLVELHTATPLGPHHLYYAWPRGEGRLGVLGVTAGGYSVALRTGADLLASLQGALGLTAGFVGADVRSALDAHAVLVLAAFLDALRASRLLSELRHERPLETVTAGEVAARLEDSRVDDPRWPLCALASVLPFQLADIAPEANVSAALERLVAAGLLECGGASGALPPLYAPAAALQPLVEECSRAVAHVALSVFSPGPDGGAAYESVLLLRGPLSLWLLSVSPGGGGLASLSPAGAARVLERLAVPAAERSETARG